MAKNSLISHPMEGPVETEAPAIEALGSLFKLTEVYLWDDGWPEKREPESCKLRQNIDAASSNTVSAASDFSLSVEDVVLVEQMNELGLPLSFQTNKENGMTRSKRKSARTKHSHKETKNGPLQVLKVSEAGIAPCTASLDITSNSFRSESMLPAESESPLLMDFSESECPSKAEEFASSSRISGASVQDEIGNIILPIVSNDARDSAFLQCDVMHNDDMKSSSTLEAGVPLECCLIDTGMGNGSEELSGHERTYDYLEQSSVTICGKEEDICNSSSDQPLLPEEVVNHEEIGSYVSNCEFGDWKVHWDDFYMRNYFYNTKTHVSTWDPPPGLENLVFLNITDKSNKISVDVTSTIDSSSISNLYSRSADLSVSDNCLESFPESLNCSRQDNTTCFLSDTHEHNNSQQKNVMQLDSYEADSSKSKSEFIDCTGDVDSVQQLEKLDTNFKCNNEAAIQVSNDASELNEAVTEGDDGLLTPIIPWIDSSNIQLVPGGTKNKNKARRRRTQRKHSVETEELQFQEMSVEFSANIGKYWWQRYLLFSRFDDGIRMDEEGWFSVTPESLARHHAIRCDGGIIVDCFTGAGGNAIQFAQRSKHVIAVDIDPKKIDYAYHNATIYGVGEQIDFLVGDFFILAQTLKADTVFLSPPWGGPDYAKAEKYDIQTMLKPHDGSFLFNCAKGIASRVVMFLPRNVDLNQLAELSLSTSPSWSLEVEKNFLNGKLKAVTAYFNKNSS